MDQEHTITLYSLQRNDVFDIIEKEGNYFVKMRFVREKYQDVAHVFLTAYEWYVQHAQKLVPKPPQAESAVWAFPDPRNLERADGCKLLTLEVPAEEVILFDMFEWSDILNFRYIGKKDDVEAFNRKINAQGINDPLDIITTPYYPLLKRELQSSWNNLFRKPTHSTHVQAGLWQLKKDWIVGVESY